jgi:tetratricopeptide (TPR) repeat protein
LRYLLCQSAREGMERFALANGKRLKDLTDPSDLPEPKTASDWFNVGWWLQVELGRSDEAEAAYRRAIEIDPNYGRPEEAESVYRRAVEIDPKSPVGWRGLGYAAMYYSNDLDLAEASLIKAHALAPDSLVAASNLAALYLIRSDPKGETMLDAVIGRHPISGAGLLTAIRALMHDEIESAKTAIKAALDDDGTKVFGTYSGFLALILRLAAERGHGDNLLAWLDAQGLSDRYWPLRAAFDAYLHGEPRLMDVNPEVRGVARSIYAWLDAPRRRIGHRADPVPRTGGRKRRR